LLDAALKHLSEYDWLILTSVNGVDAVWERLRKLRMVGSPMRRLKIAAIGPATRQAIELHGLKVNVVPREYVAESVVTSLRRKIKGKRVLLARAKVARDVIPRELRKLGAQVDVVEAYETVVPQSSRQRLRAALASPQGRPDWITFTSSSTVRNFVALLDESRGRVGPVHTSTGLTRHLKGVSLASIGPVTSSTLRELGLAVDVEAAEYTIPGLIKAISGREL
jgi:uroporphyrinogen-III synthase